MRTKNPHDVRSYHAECAVRHLTRAAAAFSDYVPSDDAMAFALLETCQALLEIAQADAALHERARGIAERYLAQFKESGA